MKTISQDKPFEADTLQGANNKLYALANKRTKTDEDGNTQYLADGILINSMTDKDSALKQYALDSITVTVTSGKVLYADPISRTDIADAIKCMEMNNVSEQEWKTVNGVISVTLTDFKEALLLGLQAKGAIIGV